MNPNCPFMNSKPKTTSLRTTFVLSTKLKPKNINFMKKKIYSIAIGSLAFITATLLVSTSTRAQTINTFAGTGSAGYSGDGFSAGTAQLKNPSGVALDASGNVYVADYLNHRVRKITPTGTISTVAGSSSAGAFGGDGGPATAAFLNQPAAVAFDGSGNMYITDNINNRIRKVDASGTITTVAGGASGGYSGDGGAATAALINHPVGIATDAAGNVYFSDEGNNMVRKITVTTGIISKVAGSGTAGYTGDGGAATLARLNQPKMIAIDASGNVLIADWLNHSIRKVTPSGTITTICGNGTAGFTGEGGPASAARLNSPYGICVDRDGNILIYDSWNNRIRKINTAGNIATIVGNGTYGYSGDGGYAVLAKIASAGITTDTTGKLYIADNGNHRIRVVTPAPVTISGSDVVCVGSANALTGSVSGGTWSSSATSVATVDASGNVTGVTTGTATISYVHYSGTGTIEVTVNPVPAALTAMTNLCVGFGVPFSSTTTGGTWSSSDMSIAVVDASGMVISVAPNTATTTYNVGGCIATADVTVNAIPAAIAGTTTVCIAATTTLTDATPSGTWSSSTTSVASIDATGTVTGVAAGTATISYSLASGCFVTSTVTVEACPTLVNNIAGTTDMIRIHPNPSTGIFSIDAPVHQGDLNITIYDMLGKMIYSNNAGNATSASCMVSGIAPGNYIIKVTAGAKIYRNKITISN
jgi:trimeric autotransporter adhesin